MTGDREPNGNEDGEEGSRLGDRHDGRGHREERERLVARLLDRGRIEREATADALRAVPRHAFVPPGYQDQAYADRPLPIGADQTISAPHMVGRMVDLLDLTPDDRVLEIGTGCGYHAAVTAEIANKVQSVEYHASLAREARERLSELGYENVGVHVGDGRDGYPEGAPYDAAYLTCAASDVPEAIVDQVTTGGVIVAPIETGSLLGRRPQTLVRAVEQPDGSLSRERYGNVRFVRMQGSQ